MCVSEEYANSDNCNKELNYFENSSNRVICVLLQKLSEITPKSPNFLSQINRIMGHGDEFYYEAFEESAIDGVINRISSALMALPSYANTPIPMYSGILLKRSDWRWWRWNERFVEVHDSEVLVSVTEGLKHHSQIECQSVSVEELSKIKTLVVRGSGGKVFYFQAKNKEADLQNLKINIKAGLRSKVVAKN